MAWSLLDLSLDTVRQKTKELHGDVDFVQALRHGWSSWVDVALTAAQVKALNTTPIVLIAAPGAGAYIIVREVIASIVFNSAAYACNASGAALKYKSDASGASVGISLTQAFIQAASGTVAAHVRGSATALAPDVNQPVVIQAVSTDPTTGDSVINLRVYYQVVPVALP